MDSTVKKRSIVIGCHKTSISLEDIFWSSLKQIACERAITVSDLIGSLDAVRKDGNLSSAIRVYVLEHHRAMAAASLQGDRKTGLYEMGYS